MCNEFSFIKQGGERARVAAPVEHGRSTREDRAKRGRRRRVGARDRVAAYGEDQRDHCVAQWRNPSKTDKH